MQKSVIVTGANSGIGLECVRQFLDIGWIVYAISRNSNNIKEIVNKKLHIYECDVCDFDRLKKIIDEIRLSAVQIDVLLNNAGIAYYQEIEALAHDRITEMIDINIRGFTNLIELVLPVLQQQTNGTIVNVSSLADRHPRPKSSVYAATKAYVKSLSDSIRQGNAKNNIRIINLAPANINTPLLQSIKKMDTGYIGVSNFVKIIKNIIELPQDITVRDMVIAPTSYEG